MIRTTVYLNRRDAEKFKAYCEKHDINMINIRDVEYVFEMKSKKLEKFMRYAKVFNNKVFDVSLTD